jgi:type I restriction enzyme S subunit
MRIRVIESIVNSKFVKYFLETPSARRYIEDVSVSTAGQNSINQKQLTALRIPIAPLEEQNRIVKHIDTMFSQCDVTVVRANRAHDILASLERSILSRAFCGQLVPQDSRDESASVMLERLRDRNEHTSK